MFYQQIKDVKNKQETCNVFFRPKLTVNQPNDIYEQEADAMADKVMRMADPAVGQANFFKPSNNALQRKCSACEEDHKIQLKEISETGSTGNNGLDSYVGSLNSSGQPLPENSRQFFEPKFGHDFSNVKLHTDSVAAKSAQSINALAYTSGNNIVFNSGQYSPDSESGKKLIAHELTHVVQQAHIQQKVQRKILIGNAPMAVDDQYKKTVNDTFGPIALKVMLSMHNNGADPEYKFDDWEAYRKELKLRSSTVEGMNIANDTTRNCCNYPTTDPGGKLDPVFWEKVGRFDFRARYPLPDGQNASDAIDAIFKPNAGTQLECLTMGTAVAYYGLLQTLGKDKFNKMFPQGGGLIIAQLGEHLLQSVVNTPKYHEFSGQKITALAAGDHGYFKNFKDYIDKHPGGLWSGENVIYFGDGKFSGFGMEALNENDILDRLVEKYNEGLPDADKKDRAALIKEHGGFTGFITRPVIGEILKK
jgi:hypothetical protein